MNTTVRSILKKSAYRSIGALTRCNTSDSIVITGSPRSGTTWLLEIMRKIPGYKAVNEPFRFREVRRRHDFTLRTFIAPDEQAPNQRRYLRRVLTGRLDTFPRETGPWHFTSRSQWGQLVEHATHRKIVVKFCRLSRMLHWFAATFNVRGIIFVVRHPCAVIASMLDQGAWDGWAGLDFDGQEVLNHEALTAGLPTVLRDKFQPLVLRATTQVEMLAIMWCLDHYIPLVHNSAHGYPWIMVPYERLVSQGQEELDRIGRAFDMEITRSMNDHLRKPSSSVRDHLHRDEERQLSKWRKRLTSDEITSILRIVDEANLSAYSDSLKPDYDLLREWQRPEWAWH